MGVGGGSVKPPRFRIRTEFSMELQVVRWDRNEKPTEAALKSRLQAEGLSFYAWSNGPHDVYEAHSHEYNKVIYCVSGSITFGLPKLDRNLTLHPGDRLELPTGTVHNAVVGGEGVVCLEAHVASGLIVR